MELESHKIKISELLNLRRNHILTVNPEYQQGAVWDEAQQLLQSVFKEAFEGKEKLDDESEELSLAAEPNNGYKNYKSSVE